MYIKSSQSDCDVNLQYFECHAEMKKDTGQRSCTRMKPNLFSFTEQAENPTQSP